MKYEKQIKEKYYRAYQLDWMLSHGWSLQDAYELVVGLMAENVDENPAEAPTTGGDIWLHAEKAKDAFLYDAGFGSGSMFACMDEFLGVEFRDKDYMEHLFAVTHAPEKDRVFWYREVCGEGVPNPEDPYADAVEKLIEVLNAEGPEAIKAFIGDDVPETEEGIRRAILKVYSDMSEDEFLNTLKEHGLRQWFASFVIDGRYCAGVWAKDQEEAEKEAKNCYYAADFGDLECVDSKIDHIEDDRENFLDPLD